MWTNAVKAIGTVAGSAASSPSSSGVLQSVGKYATDAFGWLNKNPEAANVLGGVASGIGTAYMVNRQSKNERAMARDRFRHDEKMYGRQRRDQMINPGNVSNYGSHVNSLSKGLLSHGMVTEQ